MKKQRYKSIKIDWHKVKNAIYEWFLDLLWLVGMINVVMGVYTLFGWGLALIVAGSFCLACAYFKTQQHYENGSEN